MRVNSGKPENLQDKRAVKMAKGNDQGSSNKRRDMKTLSLGTFGKMLAMRPQGRRVQESLDAQLRDLPPGGVLVLDFDNVEMMDYSFADEALGTLYSRLAAKEYPDRYLVLVTDESEITGALLENVEVALNQREVAALVVPREVFSGAPKDKDKKIEWRIIGQLPEHLIETLSAVIDKQEVTVRDLVDALGLDSVTACNNRIARLHQLRLVRRKASIVPEGGRQYCYSSVLRANENTS
jgi:hypothetical protein